MDSPCQPPSVQMACAKQVNKNRATGNKQTNRTLLLTDILMVEFRTKHDSSKHQWMTVPHKHIELLNKEIILKEAYPKSLKNFPFTLQTAEQPCSQTFIENGSLMGQTSIHSNGNYWCKRNIPITFTVRTPFDIFLLFKMKRWTF